MGKTFLSGLTLFLKMNPAFKAIYVAINMERLACFIFVCINTILLFLNHFLDVSEYEWCFISPATIFFCFFPFLTSLPNSWTFSYCSVLSQVQSSDRRCNRFQDCNWPKTPLDCLFSLSLFIESFIFSDPNEFLF